MRQFAWVALAALVSVHLSALPATAQKRVALVIGNSAYQHAPPLKNPKNDAADIGIALKAHGFQVVEGLDLTKAALEAKIRDFARTLEGSEVGLFFYAGHGLQVSGQNYLVPIDARLSTTDALEFEMVRLDILQRIMERVTSTNVIFLDACRDNPLSRNLARAMGTRSADVGRGLAPVESGVGTLISFSTQPGNVALDGDGRNSPFAGALAKYAATSNEDLSAILIAVRNEVMQATQRKQVPWEHSALTGKFYFTKSRADPAPSLSVPKNGAAEAWAVVKDTTVIADLEAFIRRYGDSFYADLARTRLQDLRRQKAASVQPPAGSTDPRPPPATSRELARVQAEGLTAVVRQATKARDRVSLVVEITNPSRARVGIAIEQYPMGNAGGLLGDDGTSCANPKLQGLVPLWVYGNYDAGVEDRQQTIIAPQESITAIISFAASDCKGAKRFNSGTLTLQLFFIKDRNINKRASLVIPSIQLSAPSAN